MKRRFLSICMALALCLTLLPAAAWASDGDVTRPEGDGSAGESESTTGSGEEVQVKSWPALIAALKADNSSITLMCDVTREEGEEGDAAITIRGGKELTIDLNGHTLNGAGSGSVITVESGGKLTITSTARDEESTPGKITGGIYAAGTVTIGGDAEITDNTAANSGGVYNEGGTVTIQDKAKITNNTAAVTGTGGVYNAGTFQMEGGAIHGNTANAAADFYNSYSKGDDYGGTFALVRAEGCAWYLDEPGERYADGHWTPYEIQGTESSG